jgi:hypothetical protein
MKVRTIPLLIFASSLVGCMSAALAERPRLTLDTVFYVRHDGNNENSGLSDDKNGAWADPQYAIDYVLDNIDLSHFKATIEIERGRWTPATHGYACEGRHVGRGRLIVEGARSGDTIIDGTVNGGAGFTISNDCEIYIRHLVIAPGTGGNGLQVVDHAHVYFSDIRWEQAKNAQIWISRGTVVEQIGPDVIAGSAAYHILASHSGHFRNVGQPTDFVNDADFTSYAYASSHGDITYTYIDPALKPVIRTNRFKVTGRKCLADLDGTVQAASLGPDFFPGTIECFHTSGGQTEE